jgi:hypothetical protein
LHQYWRCNSNLTQNKKTGGRIKETVEEDSQTRKSLPPVLGLYQNTGMTKEQQIEDRRDHTQTDVGDRRLIEEMSAELTRAKLEFSRMAPENRPATNHQMEIKKYDKKYHLNTLKET